MYEFDICGTNILCSSLGLLLGPEIILVHNLVKLVSAVALPVGESALMLHRKAVLGAVRHPPFCSAYGFFLKDDKLERLGSSMMVVLQCVKDVFPSCLIRLTLICRGYLDRWLNVLMCLPCAGVTFKIPNERSDMAMN